MKNEETERVQGFGFHRLAAGQLVFLLLPRRCKLRFPRREAISRGLDAILRHQFLCIGIILRHAGRHDGFGLLDARGVHASRTIARSFFNTGPTRAAPSASNRSNCRCAKMGDCTGLSPSAAS